VLRGDVFSPVLEEEILPEPNQARDHSE
jgi:hypothetical protein